MADYAPLLDDFDKPRTDVRSPRVASVDVFRGLCVFLMMLVDYGGAIVPVIAHSAWNGLHLADFVMPFFLFIAGVSLALVYKRVTNKAEATWKAVLRAVKLFLLGVLLQGGYLHGVSSLTYGIDIERIRWFGVLQRISIGYVVAALCEIWFSHEAHRDVDFAKSYHWHWFLAAFLTLIYLSLSYGLYVPDWQFEVPSLYESSLLAMTPSSSYLVKCSVRGDLGPACNVAGMIDRYAIGIKHLYMKPVYRNLKDCNISTSGQVSENAPSWCHSPFDPEGILSSLTAAVTCIIGLQYGHVLANLQDPKRRLNNWFLIAVLLFVPGTILALIGIPVNKSLYTVSYMMVTSAAAGITFCALYLLVDVYGYKQLTSVLEWMGKHSLSIFILVTSNVAVVVLQGFYWKVPDNNIIHWIVTLALRR